MRPMQELASLPLLWGREGIRESKRVVESGSCSDWRFDAQCQFGLGLRRLDQPMAHETRICRLVCLDDC